MGPFVRVDVASVGERRPGVDEPGALRGALELASRDLTMLSARTGAVAAECLEFQLALIEDEAVTRPAFDDVASGIAADVAWRRAMDVLISQYGADPSEYLRARCLDVADLRDRVLNAFHGERLAVAPLAGAIIVADDLAPSRFLEIDWSSGGGLALSRGSTMGHTAILARARDVPMLVQIGDIPQASQALLDAEAGVLELDPPEERTRAFGARRAAYAARRARVERVDARSPAVYRGDPVRLLINIEGPDSLSHPAAQLADGVGLMRTEFLFEGRDAAPDEEAQLQSYAAVLRWAGERPVTIRTVDAGGDKAIRGLSEAGEANPFLGLRGLRLSLRRPETFKTQLRALARAAAVGNLKVMFPMVTAPHEFAAARALFDRIVDDLKAERREARAPELGMMVEVPAAALTIADFPAAFFSIGTNDLAQYVMACDRTNGAVSHLFDPMNPAVIELIRRVVDHGRASGKAVSLCGDVASDPRHVLTLLDCGLRELSMSPSSLAAVKAAVTASAQEAKRV
jgi:phosphoenolpyruvate-protein phosphotransferase (PTS system enzyme I)